MQPLVFYFNELSSPQIDITPHELQCWSSWALSLIAGLKKVSHSQPEYILAFPNGQWHAPRATNKPLSAWMKEWVGKEHYMWFLAKIRNVAQSDDLLQQVYFQNQSTMGLTLARIADSWAFSFPKTGSPWLSHSIMANEYLSESGDIIHVECEISHLANEEHAFYWQEKLNDWGRNEASNNTVGTISGYPVEMYPLDHGHPHVHLVDSRTNETLAKFRIDKFERMQGPPRWDTETRGWVDRNRAELMRSWERCKRGGHPYQIEEDA